MHNVRLVHTQHSLLMRISDENGRLIRWLSNAIELQFDTAKKMNANIQLQSENIQKLESNLGGTLNVNENGIRNTDNTGNTMNEYTKIIEENTKYQKETIQKMRQLIPLTNLLIDTKEDIQVQMKGLYDRMESLNEYILRTLAEIRNGSEKNTKGEFSEHILGSPLFKDVIPNNKRLKLLYSGRENNFKASKFHELVDGKKSTITVIKTVDNELIGGYTPIAWENKSYLSDSTLGGFIFSIYKGTKLRHFKNYDKALSYSSSDGPRFGEADLVVADGCDKNFNSFMKIGESYYSEKYHKKIYKFKVVNYEVYQVVDK